MSVFADSIAARVGQIVATLAVVSGLIFWRGSALGDITTALGKINRAELRTPLSNRVGQLKYFMRARLVLLVLFFHCLCYCLYSLELSLQFLSAATNRPDPGHARILEEDALALSGWCLWACFFGSVFIFLEWIIDSVCRYRDLDASLAVMHSYNHIECAESIYFQLDPYADTLTLWQMRMRFCIKEYGAAELTGILERLGDSDVSWSDVSTAICNFRRLTAQEIRTRAPGSDSE